ncbi:MAG: hypothetical protein AVO33_04660 [delta proteobacterium ML8_F1]|nr:MAG: hypothetical protein AVO33_04660 [delta proteobacterium ML8_F1]
MNRKLLLQGRIARALVGVLWLGLLWGTFLGHSAWAMGLLLGLVVLHGYEVPRYGLPFGKERGFSSGYAILMTLIFGITWYRMTP